MCVAFEEKMKILRLFQKNYIRRVAETLPKFASNMWYIWQILPEAITMRTLYNIDRPNRTST
jgi:hypothetical protein